jgi:hypothetical protein
MKSVAGHKMKVNKASNISDFMIKYPECYDTPSVAGMVGLGIGTQPTFIQANPGPQLSELDLRTMLEHSRGYRPDIVEGRWVIVT